MDKNKQHCFGNLMLFNIFNKKNQFFSSAAKYYIQRRSGAQKIKGTIQDF
jgi:hypothetical protein